ncbi:excinuclease ABC subunit UvrA [Hymenobacter sp. BT186]|uniref:UvrABC system protein A n=1 Tax=Hymenobacter telluris TaxID=2816474 RepID=A0A939JAG6_9BACT|nr:excinuclease ABC subunit UvrA [Hymenobacter telluris]MBO0359859.1 excinuclease ABC subunit UvrA [Hymenobacter telluris]MBW3375886.1 excinuclease ABC subunit UvrA [Hymenobacter norwichensis]
MADNSALQMTAPAADPIDQLDPREFILIKNARVHNLKNLSVALPRNKFIVVTGLSGSGKSSLAFDTLYAEGQRMYVESLSSYARQFLGRMDKPDVDYIRGISPAIAIEQKVSIKNNRSTVGTSTEIYDYLKLLFARVGRTYSPVSGEQVRKDNVADVVDYLMQLPGGTRVMLLAPLLRADDGRPMSKELDLLLQKGYSRVVVNDETAFIEELIAEGQPEVQGDVFVMIDRAVIHPGDEDLMFRLSDSVQTAFFEGHGTTVASYQLPVAGDQNEPATGNSQPATEKIFSDRFELDGVVFEEPSVNFFSFNNPYGACQTCEGFGSVLGIDEDLVIPDKSMTVYEGAIAPWRTDKQSEWLKPLLKNGIRFDFPIHRPYNELSEAERTLIWKGNKYFDGLDDYFKWVATQTHKIQYRVLQSRYRGRTTCPDCRGTRLRKDAQYVKIDGQSITDLVLLPVSRALEFFQNMNLDEHDAKVAERLVTEITNRLEYLNRVGLGYLTLNRLSSTLSGGESQRISLATSLGSALVGSMYILDEPSIGLHPKDAEQLIGVLRSLQQLGNTVIVVEHEEKMMEVADQILDIGPEAGSGGGNLMFQGTYDDLLQDTNTYTGDYLSGRREVAVPTTRRPWRNALELTGARENNLKNVSVKFPLNVMTVVTGVSGSGKSTLIRRILAPALLKQLGGGAGEATGKFDRLTGVNGQVTHVEFVDQNPIGKSSRSNPVTYVKAYDAIRSLFADQPLAKARGFKPSHFSFNIDGGRCEVCQGEGQVKIEMQFMADIYLTCEACEGRKFKQDILDVKFQDKAINEVLEMTIEDSITFFKDQPKIAERLKPLEDVGLGYIRLGQSANTLSGGEAQRVKLASFLTKGATLQNDKILFIFDEPSTGLHFHDINKLMTALNALVEQGNSVLIIEHNMDIIKCADWVIDLGPEGGINGGHLLFEGTPEDMVKLKDTNHTARFLAEKL